ncbi:NmrA family NAD(P)-binding protein [Curtobacterium sp. BH-2-1-1]|uniref:NmrA family NAD(P)-binding protein n=1 Tax=Curtobacterium sp. BH-2-1-1 TaxID=1905847 RepID=UPI0011A94C72|nr:NmrA family NAD(P)-binding protein [Curtobacterium sp. BH-2-1-1]
MQITVTGASGHLGSLVVEHLLSRGVAASDIVATGRSVDALADLTARGVRAVQADYDDVASLQAAFAGTDTLVLVSSSAVGQRARQHGNAITAAAAAGVTHVVYTSAPHADTSTLILAPEHKATEELLRDAPFDATVLRNNWYNENYEQAFAQAAQSGSYLASTGDGRVASAARTDFAEAAAIVAATDRHRGETLELAGDTAWDGATFADTASDVLGRPVAFQPVDSATHQQILLGAGLDEGTVGFLVALDANIAQGLLDGPSTVLSDLLGRPTTPLRKTMQTWADGSGTVAS